MWKYFKWVKSEVLQLNDLSKLNMIDTNVGRKKKFFSNTITNNSVPNLFLQKTDENWPALFLISISNHKVRQTCLPNFIEMALAVFFNRFGKSEKQHGPSKNDVGNVNGKAFLPADLNKTDFHDKSEHELEMILGCAQACGTENRLT